MTHDCAVKLGAEDGPPAGLVHLLEASAAAKVTKAGLPALTSVVAGPITCSIEAPSPLRQCKQLHAKWKPCNDLTWHLRECHLVPGSPTGSQAP